MTINHGLYTDTLWAVPVTFTDAGGEALDLSGSHYVLDVIAAGETVFSFKSTGGGATDGEIDRTNAATGQLNFTATEAQHADFAAGLYRLHLYTTGTDSIWQATGKMLVGDPGAKETYLTFDAVENGEAQVANPIQIAAGGGSDHGSLSGLEDDDHPQYLTQSRGDARYYTETEADALLAQKQPLALVLTNTTASFTAAMETKLGHITVTQAVDLDVLETRVNALDAAVVLMGGWDASAGTFPGSGTAQAGASYIVTVAGSVGGIAFSVNDRVLAITDNASTSTYANNWLKLDYTDQVLSVNGYIGAVTLAKSDVGLGNVDNTSDASKPISTATQTALDGKETADADILKADVTKNLKAGFNATTYDAGTKSTGTFTPDETLGNEQKYTNNGAHTLAPPGLTAGQATAMTIDVTNGASAGAITTGGFTKVKGDSFTTTNGHKFKLFIHVSDLGSLLNVVALQ